MSTQLDMIRRVSSVGLRSGNIEYGFWCHHGASYIYPFIMGKPLPSIDADCAKSVPLMEELKQVCALLMSTVFRFLLSHEMMLSPAERTDVGNPKWMAACTELDGGSRGCPCLAWACVEEGARRKQGDSHCAALPDFRSIFVLWTLQTCCGVRIGKRGRVQWGS